jgi:hypothetical protein
MREIRRRGGQPMQLDMQTMSAVNVAVTAVLGGVLLLTWAREQESPFVGWWGFALLLQAAGAAAAAVASPINANELVAIGTASIILGDGLKWKASREFAHRRARLLWILLGPVGFMLAVRLGYLESFDHRLNAVCTISPPTTSPRRPNSPGLRASRSFRAGRR